VKKNLLVVPTQSIVLKFTVIMQIEMKVMRGIGCIASTGTYLERKLSTPRERHIM
jgi:hypothetical protein